MKTIAQFDGKVLVKALSFPVFGMALAGNHLPWEISLSGQSSLYLIGAFCMIGIAYWLCEIRIYDDTRQEGSNLITRMRKFSIEIQKKEKGTAVPSRANVYWHIAGYCLTFAKIVGMMIFTVLASSASQIIILYLLLYFVVYLPIAALIDYLP